MQVTNFNLWDLINLVRSPQWYEETKGRYNHSYLDKTDASFHGIESHAEINTILNKEVSKSDGLIHHNKIFDMVSDVAGSVVNIDAYIQGQPEDMYSFISSESNIVQDLNLYLSVSWKVAAKEIQDAANRVKKYIESKPANVSLNINLRTDYKLSDGRPYGNVKSIVINIARADDYLTDQVVNILGHVMFFRYFICNYIFLSNNSNGTPEKSAEGYDDFMTFNKTWEI